MHREVVVVGAGPSGVRCAVDLRLSGVKPLVVNEGEIGGMVNNAFLIENLPRSRPLSGPTLAKKLANDLARSEIDVVPGRVTDLKFHSEERFFSMKVHGQPISARHVVAATGTQPKRIPSLEFPGRAFYEVRQLRDVQDAVVTVVGSGEAAYDSALTLSAQRNRVVLLTKKGTAGLSPPLVSRVFANKNIQLELANPALTVSPKENALEVCTANGTYRSDYLLISIGREPDLRLVRTQEIKRHPNFHLCGDVKQGRLHYCATALHDGAATAQQILRRTRRDGLS